MTALAQTKGGVGKTTLAVNLAVARTQAGRDLLLVDADEQGTASDFTELRTEQFGSPGYTAIQLSGVAVRTQVLQMAGKYQDVIIDAGGRDTSALRAALTVADVAVIPFQPRSFDIWVLDKAADFITEARIINPKLRAVSTSRTLKALTTSRLLKLSPTPTPSNSSTALSVVARRFPMQPPKVAASSSCNVPIPRPTKN